MAALYASPVVHLIAVAKISDWFDPPAWGAPERRFNGSVLSGVRESSWVGGHPTAHFFWQPIYNLDMFRADRGKRTQ